MILGKNQEISVLLSFSLDNPDDIIGVIFSDFRKLKRHTMVHMLCDIDYWPLCVKCGPLSPVN